MRIQVPATTANLGPGFDSCGLALDLYLTLTVCEKSSAWRVEHQLAGDIPKDETNMVIQVARKLAPELTPHRLVMESDIPPARGLGSSSAAIVAGIELANQLAGLGLSCDEIVRLAAEFEGHPDNIAPAILGGLVVCAKQPDRDFYLQHAFPDVAILAVIPEEALLTSESRAVLPRELSYSDAVQASSVANVMVAALVAGDLRLAGEMMERDLFHETYRAKLVPHLIEIRKKVAEFGGYAAVLSGAGPTVLVLAPREVSETLRQELCGLDLEAEVKQLRAEPSGARVFK
ncbi:homoserine kinase [Listeria valentina]|uniref:homoserine kinase n=1 Tax=Listeria valentina TaxID=2705293 RepID=UPI001430D0E5|nr:homoserine kinase [Listeria valentina]